VVGADSNVGGVGVSEGSSSDGMGGIGTLDNMSSVVDNRGDDSSVCDRNRVQGDLGLSITLHDVLNSVVLGDVLGSEGSVGHSGVVAGVVVAGHAVGDGGSNIG